MGKGDAKYDHYDENAQDGAEQAGHEEARNVNEPVIERLVREEQRRKPGHCQRGEIAGDERVDEHAQEIRVAPVGDGENGEQGDADDQVKTLKCQKTAAETGWL
jgi:hypothetical protein